VNINLQLKDITRETFLLTGEINDNKIINNLIHFVKNNKDKELYHKTNVKGHFTGFTSLIHNEDFHSFLKLIKPPIQVIYKNNFIISEAWGNVCEFNDEVIEHDHRGTSAFCGILYLTEGGSGTFFKDFNITIEEKIGRYVLFHPFLLHSVEKNTTNFERITIAFNMNQVKPWDNTDNVTWVNKDDI
jgi:hypothetical protein